MAHIHERIDYTVDVFVVHNDKVLIRKHEKYHKWFAVGGHIELDEDPNEAAIREVKEEVNLDIRLIDTRMFREERPNQRELIAPMGLNRHRISDTHEHIAMFYAAVSDSNDVVPENPNDEWVWCKEEEIESLPDILPEIVFYAKRALQLARQ